MILGRDCYQKADSEPGGATLMDARVTNVAEFIEELTTLRLREGSMRFFRGHADFRKYKIRPTVYRHRRFIANESNLINEAVIRCPADFPDSCTFFEKLVRLQHYGLPTRLLDVTSNALAALYFACREKERTTGEVLVFDIPQEDIKYYNSDTVAVIANLARRPYSFDLDRLPTSQKHFNEDPEMGRLLFDIQEDKPAFRPIIRKDDLRRVVCARAKLDNARIARQDGAFLLFGIRDKKSKSATVPSDWIVCGNDSKRIIFSNKHGIKQELAQFGISEQTLFPELDYQTKSIVQRFKGKYRRRSGHRK
jgi:hypothetical protein